MKRLAGIDRRAALWFAAALLPALLLFLPVFPYSLTTSFSLNDEYENSGFVAFFDGPQEFLFHLRKAFLFSDWGDRYRPMWDLDMAVAWKFFGPASWLHHLNRWVFHLAAVPLFVAAFLCVVRDGREAALRRDGDGGRLRTPNLPMLLPPIALVYVWLFFPNVPAIRLDVPEVDTVLFLGLCNLAFALLLVDRHEGGMRSGGATRWLHGLFHLGCIGLSLSKEVNVAPLLWMSIAYGVLLYVKGGRSWKTLLGAAPLALLFLFTLDRVLEASSRGGGVGYGHSWSIGRTLANEKVLRTQLFQVETSLAVTAGLAVLAAVLLLAVTSRILRSAAGGARPGSAPLFVLFLLGQFASLYAALSMSWGVALRYWYPLVPCFATLLAFGARFLLLAARRRWGRAAAVGLIGFVLFFVSVNYHDFLYQTIGQHSQRRVDERLIATITRFLDEGETVDVLAKTGADGHPEALPRFLTVVFSSFMPRFHDRSYSIRRLPSIDYDAVLGGRVAWRLRRWEPAVDRPSPPSWVVALREESALSGEERAVFSARENYRLLSWTRALAGLLQGTPWPYLHHDGGIYPLYSDLYDNPYRWTIYRGARMADLSDAFKSRLVE